MNPYQHYTSFGRLILSLKEYRSGVVILVLLHVAGMLVELIIPFITRALVDQGITNQDIDFIYVVIIGMLMLTLGNIFINIFKLWLTRHIGVRVNMNLLNAFMERLIRKSILFFAKKNSGEIIQLVNDNFRVEKFFTHSISFLIELSLKLLAFGIVLFIFSVPVGLVYFAAILLGFGWDMLFLRARAKQDKMKFQVSSSARGDIVETVQGINDIKVFKLEEHRLRRWYGIQNFLAKTSLNLLRIHNINHTGTNIINQLRDVSIMFFAAMSVVDGKMTLGSMLAIQYIIGELNRKTNTLVHFVAESQEAKLSFDRLKKVMEAPDIEPFVEDGINYLPENASIKLEEVQFAYDQKPVIKNINLEIPKGKNVAIVGESGSGKSTLVKLILRLLSPDSGNIKVGEKKLALLNTDVWRNSCCILMQESVIFDGSVRYNITLEDDERKVDREFLEQIIQMCALEEIINGLPQGLKTLLGKEGTALSRGQAQRVLLARTVYKNAPYLIMDEPTSALDAVTAFDVFENIKNYYENQTIILITHKINIARQMDIIFVMDDGKIVEQGNHEQLMSNKGKYHQLATIK